MKHETLMKFKARFENERTKLVYSHFGLTSEVFHLAKDDLLDEADFTSTELETSMRMRLRNRETLFLKKIDEAMQRISEGSFGACEECGEEIDIKRLEARPTTTHCVDCKEEQERQELHHIDGHRHKSLGAKLVRLA